MGLNIGQGIGGLVGEAAGGPLGLLAGGVVGSGGNLQNQIMGGAPQYTQPTMDPQSQAAVNQAQQQQTQSSQDLTNQYMQGTGAAKGVQDVSGAQANSNNELGGGGINGMSAAIANKAGKNFDTNMGRTQANANLQGVMNNMQNTNAATANAVALANAQRGVDASVLQYNLQASAARYGVISSTMQGAGAIGGMMAANYNGQPQNNYNYNSQYGVGETPSIYNQAQNPTGSAAMGDYGAGMQSNQSMGNYGLGAGFLEE